MAALGIMPPLLGGSGWSLPGASHGDLSLSMSARPVPEQLDQQIRARCYVSKCATCSGTMLQCDTTLMRCIV